MVCSPGGALGGRPGRRAGAENRRKSLRRLGAAAPEPRASSQGGSEGSLRAAEVDRTRPTEYERLVATTAPASEAALANVWFRRASSRHKLARRVDESMNDTTVPTCGADAEAPLRVARVHAAADEKGVSTGSLPTLEPVDGPGRSGGSGGARVERLRDASA